MCEKTFASSLPDINPIRIALLFLPPNGTHPTLSRNLISDNDFDSIRVCVVGLDSLEQHRKCCRTLEGLKSFLGFSSCFAHEAMQIFLLTLSLMTYKTSFARSKLPATVKLSAAQNGLKLDEFRGRNRVKAEPWQFRLMKLDWNCTKCLKAFPINHLNSQSTQESSLAGCTTQNALKRLALRL